MSGRRRRSEIIWDDKEERRASAEIHSNISSGRSQHWSKSEAHDVMMRGDFSRSPSRDHLQRNRNGPRDDDMRRDRNRMYSRSTPDGWEKQYSSHPSDERYGLPYRPRDKEAGGNVRMSRERTRSPHRSRSRSREGVGRSSRGSTRDPRHESDASYPNMRNNSKDFASRGGGNNITESWSHRTDYKGASRYNDNRNTRIPCKFFAAGNCNRDYCKFSHDVPEAAVGYDDNRSLSNKNRAWRNDQQPHDDDPNAESNLGEMEKKSWNGSVWNDDNNKNTWDSWGDKKKLFDGHASRDASGFHDDGKSHPNVDNKRSSWDDPTSWEDGVSRSGFSNASNRGHKYEESVKDSLNDNNEKGGMSAKSGSNVERNRTKKGVDVESGFFNLTSRQGHTLGDNNNNNTWDSWDDKKKLFDGHASQDASGFPDVGKSHLNLDNKRSNWNGPTSWDDGASGSGFSKALNPGHNEESAKGILNNNNDARGGMSAKSGSNIDRTKTKKWDGPLWDEFSEPVAVKFDNNNNDIRKWDGPGSSNMTSRNAKIEVNDSDLNSLVSEDSSQQIITTRKDLIQSFHDMNTLPEQRQMILSNPYNGPLNGQGQGMYVHMENQNKEGGNTLKPLEMDVPQPRAVNDVNDTSLTSEVAPQANALPAEISHIGQLPPIYTKSNLASAIDYLKSLPNPAYNHDTKAKDEQDSVTNMEVKPSVPMEILSRSVTQQNQTPADLIHDYSKLSEIGVTKNEAVDATDKVAESGKKEEKITKPENADEHRKVDEGDTGNDEKAMRQFKVSLVEFVKEILKPKWKEGKMSRDVHKTVVKKVVEKVTSTVQGSQIPRTQPKIDQYLAYSKTKITKLAEAYVEKLLKS